MREAPRKDFEWTRAPGPRWEGDAPALERALRRELEGGVGFDGGSRALYATDASNWRQPPIGVVWPRSVGDVERAVAVCRAFGAPVLSRGAGTSLAGQCCNVAVVLDTSRHLNRVLEIDPGRRTARVEPGTVLDDLRRRANGAGLTFGPDPSTHTHCTLGGMIGNNSCGIHAVMAGRTADNVRSLDVLTWDGERMRVGATDERERERIVAAGGRRGEIYAGLHALRERYADAIRARFLRIPRRVSGYNLDELLPERGFHVARALVGSEGTCAAVLEAELELVPWPEAQALLVVAFDDVYAAADRVPEVLATEPLGLEGLDDVLIADQRTKGMNEASLRLFPEAGGWLVVEYGGETPAAARARAEEVARRVSDAGGVRDARVFEDPGDQERIWAIRKSGLGATARVPGQGDTWPGWEDSAVAPERMGAYLRELRALLDRYGYHGAFYGHFGDGCLHTRIDFDLRSPRGRERYRAFVDEAADLCVRHGGSLSGEHGDGQSRAELLPKMYGEDLCGAFSEFKRIWDPEDRMNPGKLVRPDPILANLRLGEGYRPWQPETHFRYPEDDFRFERAPLRCVGVGKCRRESWAGGTMCPSYMVTREERHSTRGRAHLLFEMLRGEVIQDGWRSEAVREALDLCLACKGCKSDCPVNVDVATYKAEFLAHHYRGRLRPLPAYSMGLIHWWARAAARAPRLANFATQTPGLSGALKRLGGLAPERPLPRFARRPFHRRFRGAGDGDGRPRVVLFPDTFNNFFHPETAEAAAEVLTAAGWRVDLPPRILCCGRPLYDYGMLHLAKRLLRRVLDVLSDDIQDGTPIVGIEPSCVATFRDELPNLFPHDENARRLQEQFSTLAEFLARDEVGFEPPRLAGRPALVHGHCHHAAIMGLDAERELLGRMGLDFEVLDSGCCGLAGSFGFEKEKYAVSVAAGERALLPAVRSADSDTWLVSDGFSCRTQCEQLAGRRPLHLAELLREALRESGRLPAAGR